MGDPTPRPTALPVSPASILDALKAFNQWVLWSWVLVKGEWTKPPLSLRGGHASVTNSKTWTTYDKALTQYASGTVDGLGIVLTPQMGLVGIDLDHCRNPDDGTIDAWAAEIVQDLCTYTEVSPSGTGLRLLMWGTLPAGGRKHGDVEMYCDRRYVTITGCHLDKTPAVINRNQVVLDAFHQRTFPPQEKTAPPVPHETAILADDAVLQQAFNAKNGSAFGRLWAGKAEEYHSASNADFALCTRLAFWTRDPAQIDRLFRRSALLRNKWDDPRGKTTYGGWTIANALKAQTDFWKSPHADEWRTQMSRTKDGTPKETLGNITLALQHVEPWSTACWYDVVRDLCMVGTLELKESMLTEAAITLEAQVKIPMRAKHLVYMALTYICHQRPRDLLREWLEALPRWDGVLRLDRWLPRYAHAPSDAYGTDVSRLLMVSLVARAMDPGCQYRFVVILEGPENAGKTKLVRALVTPEWYRELSHGLDGKEAHMRIKRAWVAELAELSSLTRTEEARLKSFFTLNEDTYIPKFSNLEVAHQRRTVFIGTVNPEADNTYLRGQTGNTRYLPISVRDIDLDGFQAERIQLFAEALAYYRAHPNDWWKLSSDGEYTAQEVREERRQRSVYEDDLGMWLERTKKTVTWWDEIASDHLMLPKAQWADRRIQMEVAKALKALGWEKGPRERIQGIGLVVPWRPGSDWHPEP